jgi:hypothetical protein
MFRLADLHIICKIRQKALRLFNPELAQWFHVRLYYIIVSLKWQKPLYFKLKLAVIYIETLCFRVVQYISILDVKFVIM